MAIMLEEVHKMKVFSEEEAKATIEKYKAKSMEEGYEITKTSYQLKEKKEKGEVIDSWYILQITKRWNE